MSPFSAWIGSASARREGRGAIRPKRLEYVDTGSQLVHVKTCDGLIMCAQACLGRGWPGAAPGIGS